LTASALPVSSAAAFRGQQVYVAVCGHAQVRPTDIVFFCADAGEGVTAVKYVTYGGKVAVAHATLYTNLCEPDCAAGHYVRRRVTLTLFAVARCGRKLFYTALRTSSRPGGSTYIKPPHCGRVLS
jgi:hypothetical protein